MGKGAAGTPQSRFTCHIHGLHQNRFNGSTLVRVRPLQKLIGRFLSTFLNGEKTPLESALEKTPVVMFDPTV